MFVMCLNLLFPNPAKFVILIQIEVTSTEINGGSTSVGRPQNFFCVCPGM